MTQWVSTVNDTKKGCLLDTVRLGGERVPSLFSLYSL